MDTQHRYHPIDGRSQYPHDIQAGDDDFTDPETETRRPFGRDKWIRHLNFGSHIMAWTLVVALTLYITRTRTWGSDRFRQHKAFPAQLTYSPAQNSIDYEVKVFKQGFEDMQGGVSPEFSGPPSDRLDKAWSDLYNFGMSAISKQEASLLPNKTSPIPNSPNQYMVELDVFHQLHCLNRLRKALNPHYFCPSADPHCDDHREMGVNYDSRENIAPHLAHCLHSLRQSIMCHADIAPIVFHKSLKPGVDGTYFNQGFLSVAHTCRDFEKIRQWGLDHEHAGGFDTSIVPDDDGIVVPIFD